jgi:hypothetical protein
MTILPRDVWEKLCGSKIDGLALAARMAVPDVCGFFFAALDTDGRRHFLVKLGAGDASLTDKQSRGIQVATREMAVSGSELAKYIDIVCLDSVGHEVFQLIGGELVERLRQNADPIESVRQVLAKWRRFWGQLPKEVLSKSEQIGLFGELWFLKHWVMQICDRGESVCRWRGPLGSRHDFEWIGTSVEVKATTAAGGVIHHINGVEQLLPPDEGSLFLLSVRLREEVNARFSLSLLIAECRYILKEDADALHDFDLKLFKVGYSPSHDEEYSKVRFHIVHELLYRVQDNFPRITPKTFVNGVPPGIGAVGYDINLNGFGFLQVERELFLRNCG